MDVLERLLVTIEGSSALLRQELQKGNTAVDQFARNTDRQLGGVNKGFTGVAATMRRALGVIGVGFSARAFAGWIKGALDAKNMTEEQLAATKRAREALDGMRAASDDLARGVADRLAPAFENLSISMGFLQRTFLPTDRQQLDQQIDETERQIQDLVAVIERERAKIGKTMLFGLMDVNPGAERTVENLTRQVEELRLKWLELVKVRDAPFNAEPTQKDLEYEFELVTAIAKERERLAAAELDLVSAVALERQRVAEAEREAISELAGDVALEQQRVAAMGEGPDGWLATLGAVTPNLTLSERIDLEGFIQELNEASNEAKHLQDALGRGLRDSFVDAMMGMEVSFQDLLKRMAAEWAASEIFDAISGALSGGGGVASFFSDIFGGARASGGPVSAGKAYLVGERGPELFFPNRSGSISPNGGGVGGTTIHVDARGAQDPAAVEAAVYRGYRAAVATANAHTDAKLMAMRRPAMA